MTDTRTPIAKWAQRKDSVSIALDVADCDAEAEIVLDADPAKLFFKGVGGTGKKNYEISIDLFAAIDKEKSKFVIRPRQVEFNLVKVNEEEWWPRLTKEKVKLHYIKADWNKWVDEDEQDEAQEFDMSGMEGMGGMGGMPGMEGMGGMGGMPGMGGMGGMPGMEGLGGDQNAQLQKLMEQMQAQGMNIPGEGDTGSDADSDDLPDLEPNQPEAKDDGDDDDLPDLEKTE